MCFWRTAAMLPDLAAVLLSRSAGRMDLVNNDMASEGNWCKWTIQYVGVALRSLKFTLSGAKMTTIAHTFGTSAL